jgi:WD40 repeat protein
MHKRRTPALYAGPIGALLVLSHFLSQGVYAAAPTPDTVTTSELRLVHRLVMPQPYAGYVKPWDFSPDGKLLAVGNGDTIHLWDVATGKELAQVASEANYVEYLFFVRGGRALLYHCSARSGVRALRVPSLAHEEWIKGACDRPSCLSCSPDGKMLAFGERDNLVLYDLAARKEVWRNAYPRTTVSNCRPLVMAFSPDGRFLAVGLDHGAVSLCDVAGRKELRRYGNPITLSPIMDYSPTGKFIALGSTHYGIVDLWGPGEGKVHGEITWGLQPYDVAALRAMGVPTKLAGVRQVAVSPDGKTLAVIADDCQLHLWEVATRGLRCQTAVRRPLQCQFAPSGELLATCSWESGDICLWEWRRLRDNRPRPAADEQVDRAWTELGGDASTAYRAIDRLLASQAEAVAMLRRRLQPAKAIPQAELDRLIAALDDDRFAARERASKRLAALGPVAEKALLPTQEKNRSAEMQQRGRDLLAKLERGLPPEQARELRAVEVLESIAVPEALALLRRLADGAPGWPLTEDARAAVERLSHSPRPSE